MKYIRLTVKNQKGVTLVELLVSLLLIGIVFGTTNTFLAYGLNTYYTNRDRAEVAENLRVGLNRLSREMRMAAEFKSFTEANGGCLAFKSTGTGRTISYHISTSGDSESAKQLIRAVDGQGNNPVVRYVHKIQVVSALDGAGVEVLTVTLTGEKGRSGSREVSTTVRLRN
ncbi:MAG TPA: prepilin-type cleavage/methylation domain-containing protein [Desulfotomaculum sp.]|nr:MAG: hypothetical protein JL56_13935 [Desulfotomaculum sp. BICA1-6]HBX22272.1 prepilin-type cleavage/methylation domain-containing protein [Desulfotomaculum sp.]